MSNRDYLFKDVLRQAKCCIKDKERAEQFVKDMLARWKQACWDDIEEDILGIGNSGYEAQKWSNRPTVHQIAMHLAASLWAKKAFPRADVYDCAEHLYELGTKYEAKHSGGFECEIEEINSDFEQREKDKGGA